MNVRKKINRVLRPLTRHIITRPHFGENLEEDLARFLPPRDVNVVCDVGANEGQSAIDFLHTYPKANVHSYEPSPANLAVLNRAAEGHPRWRVHACGLGESPGKLTFHENAFGQTSSFLNAVDDLEGKVGAKGLALKQSVEVDVTTLDASCAAMNIEHIDLLKIDTQGFELSVLKGADQLLSNRAVGAVLVEILYTAYYKGQPGADELRSFLLERDYHLVNFYNPAFSQQHHLMWNDALFVPGNRGAKH
jgi:FkbM family methyltransferase